MWERGDWERGDKEIGDRRGTWHPELGTSNIEQHTA
jgi:hypothetical protein